MNQEIIRILFYKGCKLLEFLLSLPVIYGIYLIINVISVIMLYKYAQNRQYSLYKKKFLNSFSQGFLLVFYTICFFGAKLLIARPRPEIANAENFEKTFDNFSSFPSSHVGITLLTVIYFYRKKVVRQKVVYILFSTLFIFLVGISRVYLKRHYISDVVGSLFMCPVVYYVAKSIITFVKSYIKRICLSLYNILAK